jgi:adenylate cyclase
LDRAWPDVTVEENSLQVQVSALRKVLGEGWIMTVPGHGYRLIWDMPLSQSAGSDRIGPTLSVQLPDKPSIAVLPFTNMSSHAEQEFFSDGMTDDILTELSRNRSLFVISRHSSFTYKGRAVDVKTAASELGVRYILEGSIRRDGSRVRINAQLIDARIGNHVWSERYDRSVMDVFAVQDEITRAVVSATTPAISEAERSRVIRIPTAILSAWEAYHRGLWHFSTAGNLDLDPGLGFLRRAVELDPLFVEAHATLARYYLSNATREGRRSLHESLPLAESAARTALRLDNANANAHASLAWVFDHRGDAASGLEEAELAVGLNANDPAGHLAYGHILTFAHRPDEATKALLAALRLDPRGATAPTARHHIAVVLFLEGDYAAAEIAASEAIRTYGGFPRPYIYLAASLGHLGRITEGRQALQQARNAGPGFFDFMVRRRPPWLRPNDHQRLLDGLTKAGWQRRRGA